jgi:hypothetical protein
MRSMRLSLRGEVGNPDFGTVGEPQEAWNEFMRNLPRIFFTGGAGMNTSRKCCRPACNNPVAVTGELCGMCVLKLKKHLASMTKSIIVPVDKRHRIYVFAVFTFFISALVVWLGILWQMATN